jgi:hypothetical protein
MLELWDDQAALDEHARRHPATEPRAAAILGCEVEHVQLDPEEWQVLRVFP